MIKFESGFATTDGCHDAIGKYAIPKEWWSRTFEYPWASCYIDKEDTAVDAGCGVTHFFKQWLAENCAMVHAIDTAVDTGLMPGYDNLMHHRAGIDKIPLADGTADKVMCISVFEHTKNQQDILKEFARVLKPNGLVVLTLDVPTIQIDTWRGLVEKSPLDFAGSVTWEEPANILVEPPNPNRRGAAPRRVFCSVLRHRA